MNLRPPFTALLFVLSSHGLEADTDSFRQCLDNLQEEARSAGVDEQIVTTVIPRLALQQRVLELDHRQPEFVQTFGGYLKTRVTDERVARGRDIYRRYRPFLDQLTARYGVPGQYLVAFWGLETNFGSYLGNMPTLDSLATLACDTRRKDFFTTEFITALRVMERESLEPAQMRGSWAGAVGHTQFMPSSYLRYAVDGNGDGKIDLWRSEKDALASGANFLSNLGWQRGLRWGREVFLPAGFDYSLANGESRPLSEWASQGIRKADKSSLSADNVTARLLVPAGHEGPAFLVYKNFSVIMKWNQSEFYALSVGYLADRIAGGGTLHRKPPSRQPLSRAQVESMQKALIHLGYNTGEVDGIFGPASRNALSSYEEARGMVSDGYPDVEVLQSLMEDAASQ